MKKIIMYCVRALLQLVPISIKDFFKKSTWLTNLYIRSVRKAGLFYDAPTAKQTQKLYDNWLIRHEMDFRISSLPQTTWQAIVFGDNPNTSTKESLLQQGGTVYECSTRPSHFYEIMQTININIPTLCINSSDILANGAICHFLSHLGEYDFIYSDTDEVLKSGKRAKPRFLPDWNSDLHFSTAYIKTGVMLGTKALQKAQKLSVIAISELVCELAFSAGVDVIGHIPLPLVHCTENDDCYKHVASVAKSLANNPDIKVLADEQTKINRLLWRNTKPLISLIIPTKNQKALIKACIESILQLTSYGNYEILLIDNGSDEADCIAYLSHIGQHPKIKLLHYPAPFNYSAINNFGVRQAQGKVIGLINNDVEVINPQWLTYMVGHVQRSNVGCVGAKLLYSDKRIQHAGVVLGYGGGAGHAFNHFPHTHKGYLNRINATQNYSAVTAACLLVKREHYLVVGGLDEDNLAIAFNDVDLCLKVEQLGVRNVYCAEAELYHHESVSRGLDTTPEKAARFAREVAFLQRKWAHIIANDPAYNPNLTLKRENFAIKGDEDFV